MGFKNQSAVFIVVLFSFYVASDHSGRKVHQCIVGENLRKHLVSILLQLGIGTSVILSVITQLIVSLLGQND